MKLHLLKLMLLAALATAAADIRAQNAAESPVASASEGTDVRVNPPPKDEKPEKEKKEKPEKPERPNNRQDGKDTVDDVKRDFRAKADEYVKKQKELLAQVKGANAEEKKKIREKLNDLKEKWQDDQPQVRELVSDLRDKIDKEKDRDKGSGGGSRPRK